MKTLLKILAILTLFACASTYKTPENYESALLKIDSLTKNTFVHTSYLSLPGYGKVGCNGLIFYNDGEAIVFDTPTNDSASYELINWVKNELNCTVKAIVVNHFHNDCLGGLKTFHENGIVSYANTATIPLAKNDGMEVPQNGFNEKLELTIGQQKVINQFIGEGHSSDNIVSYIPSEKVLFGGCLIKEVGAQKGYLGVANVKEWPATVEKVKSTFPDITTVVPGHGEPGGTELLDYTMVLFED